MKETLANREDYRRMKPNQYHKFETILMIVMKFSAFMGDVLKVGS